MEKLDALENESIYIIREAYSKFKKMALLWSIGKDSTTLLWLCRKAFFDEIPFPVMHIDTTFKFPEMYEFRDTYTKQYGLQLLVEKNDKALSDGIGYATHDAFTCCHELKTQALMQAIKKHCFEALLVGIRRDEHGIRAKERYFSPRNEAFEWNYEQQPIELWDHYQKNTDTSRHMRIHPLLHWTELDIWEYTKRENIPINKLYFSKNGKRYRSLGCQPITTPMISNASTVDEIIAEIKTSKVAERSGRKQDKEQANMMQKLRALGYM